MRQPCFNNLLKVINRDKPDRPTLFEFYLNLPLYRKLTGLELKPGKDHLSDYTLLINAFKNAGYDYATILGSDFHFPKNETHSAKTQSMNDGAMIRDRNSFNEYPWPDPKTYDYSRLEQCESELPDEMKLIVWGHGGVLENVVSLVGYDNLCFMTVDDPELLEDIFREVGSRFVEYYRICAKYKTVGAMISNDDWGFNTQTMLSPENMRKYVFPWHKKIVEEIHAACKPAILHSCGNLENVIDDIIDDMKYDAKHSYEDKIISVEDAYVKWSDRIAILGGLDIDYLCRATPEAIKARAAGMLELSLVKGGYALGSGNSIPEYIPYENYKAMISAAGVNLP